LFRFIDDPRKMHEQIRSLEKKINDLRFAYGGEEGERLAQELRQIEQNILQQERELKLVRLPTFSMLSSTPYVFLL